MARGGKKDANAAAAAAAAAPPDPQADERKRLKRLAISKNMLSDGPAKACSAALSPSKIVAKHHGRDILKKSQRKNKFLFSFPGLLAPIAGGKIGELKDLGTKNPILYLDFPQGQMKLFGTIVYPKTRYLTLQFSRGGKNVMCEDYFDTVIVFSDAWWIGRKDENPEETRLEFPKELNESQGQQAEYNFKGGAGGACGKQQSAKPTKKCVEPESPKHELDDLSDSQNDLKEKVEVTPARHSARTAGRRFKFSEASSGDESPENNIETSEEEKEIGLEDPTKSHSSTKKENLRPVVFDIDDEDDAAVETKENVKESVTSSTKPTLVQATISTLFKKVEEKVVLVPVGTVIHLVEGEIPSIVEKDPSAPLDPWDIPGQLDADPSDSTQQTTNCTQIEESPDLKQHARAPSVKPYRQSSCKSSVVHMKDLNSIKSTTEQVDLDINDDDMALSDWEEDEEEIEDIQYNVAELTEPGQRLLVAQGGVGGLGNICTHKPFKNTQKDESDLEESDDDQRLSLSTEKR